MHSVTKLIGKVVRILYEAICGGGNLREIECDLLNGGPHSEIYGQDESEDSNKPCSVAALAAEHMDGMVPHWSTQEVDYDPPS